MIFGYARVSTKGQAANGNSLDSQLEDLKKAGYKEGRPPKYDKEQLDNALELLKTKSYSKVTKLTGISKSTLIRERNKRRQENISDK